MLLFRALLLLYPPGFRRRYGDELRATFAAMRLEPRYRGRRGRILLWRDVVLDACPSAARQRVRRLGAAIPFSSGSRPGPAPRKRRGEMETLVHDIRHALRYFVRRPAFAGVAVLSFALAIGANTAIYGILDGFVFTPFPYPEPDRLVAVGVTFPKLSSETTYIESLSPPEYLEIRSSRSFAHIAAFDLGNRNISGGDVPERVFTALVLDDLFPVIGMKPALGRGFTSEELAPNGPPAAILSHRIWQSRFGGEPGILNRAIRIGGTSASVVGVMPPGLVLVGTDLWIPWGGRPDAYPRNRRQFNVLARLAPGVTLEEANAELGTVAGRVDRDQRGRFAEYEGWRLTATPWAAAIFKDVRPAAFLLLGAVALVLLIACANLANLFLARSTTRHRELAVRLALGAARWRIARHLLTESLLLAGAGAAAGMFVAWLAFAGAGALVPDDLQMLGLEARFNGRVLMWCAALAVGSGLLVALLPALQATRTDPHEALKADPRAGGGRGARLRHALVVCEVAVSVVLLLGAGLFIRSLIKIQRVDLGFNPDGVLTVRLTVPNEKYPGEKASVFFETLIERIEAVPGVRSAAAASQFPPMGVFDVQFALEQGMPPTDTLPTALITLATPRFFETLGVSLRSGRTFSATDRPQGTPVAIVNQSFASRYFPGRDALGQRILFGTERRSSVTIVGVAADFRNSGAAQPVRPEIYVPVRQQNSNQLHVLVRSDAPPGTVLPTVRQAVLALDPEQPIYAIQTLRDAQALSSFQQRISGTLLGIFALVALTLAAVGIFGVMSYAVSARTRELGVRLALGARPGAIVWLVLRQVLLLSGLGLAIGLGLLAGTGRALEHMLYGISAVDPPTIAVVSLVLAVAALVAAWAPASRASRVDPIEALRYE